MKHVVTRNRVARVLSERLNELMDKRRLTVTKVAKRAGVAHTVVGAIARGRAGHGIATVPAVTTVVMIAKGLGVTAGYLLGEDALETLPAMLPAMPETSDEQMAEWLTAFREVDAETIAELQREIERWKLGAQAKSESSDVARLKLEIESLRTGLASTRTALGRAEKRCEKLDNDYTALESETVELRAVEKARDGDISLMRGMVDELKAAKKSLLDKLENAARERRLAEQKYFVLAEACEKAFESPTWAAALRGYVVSQDNVAAIRKLLNKNPLSDIPPANNVKSELPDGTVLAAKPANGVS